VTTKQATIAEPFLTVLGRARTVAIAQGWVLVSGGQPAAPEVPMFFRQGLGSFKPADGLQVRLVALDANRTEVEVTAWRGSVVVDGYVPDRFIQALLAHPA
jgi:hypothetical protein